MSKDLRNSKSFRAARRKYHTIALAEARMDDLIRHEETARTAVPYNRRSHLQLTRRRQLLALVIADLKQCYIL